MRNNVRPEEAQIYGNVTGYGFKVTPDWASLSMTRILSCAFRCVKEFALGFGSPAESQAITPGASGCGMRSMQRFNRPEPEASMKPTGSMATPCARMVPSWIASPGARTATASRPVNAAGQRFRRCDLPITMHLRQSAQEPGTAGTHARAGGPEISKESCSLLTRHSRLRGR